MLKSISEPTTLLAESERDQLLYKRERIRQEHTENNGLLDAKAVGKSPVLNIRQAQQKLRRTQKSRLYFENGRIGCRSAEKCPSNARSNYEYVKEIIAREDHSPLADMQIIERVLSKADFKVVEPAPEDTEIDENLKNHMMHLVGRFSKRSQTVADMLQQNPPTPPPTPPPRKIKALELFAQNEVEKIKIVEAEPSAAYDWLRPIIFWKTSETDEQAVLDPQKWFYISWLFMVTVAFVYNCCVVPLRSSFPFQTVDNTPVWIAVDTLADVVYLLDIVLFKHRLIYLEEGFWVKDPYETRRHYLKQLQFKMDLIALFPLDLLYLKLGTQAVWLRFTRLLKLQSYWEFFKLLDQVSNSPHVLRILKTLTYMTFMIHCTACLYYVYSVYQGIGTNRWVFSGRGHPYLRCFVFATKTATSIGKNPKPENEGEFMFMTAAWLSGVFVFALLIGQIRDIIATATKTRTEYQKLVDDTLQYMRSLNLPEDFQRGVQMWFKYTWDQQRTLNEGQIFEALPKNLKTDIALSVHIETLSKVKLFADCEAAFLRDLVLQLRSKIYLPGDFVCRKGDIGKEMYIIKSGYLNVLGGRNGDQVLVTLGEGAVFGEVSLMDGSDNRRTAFVQSKGFANLFVLSKDDLNEVLVYYPNAQQLMKERARELMNKNKPVRPKRSIMELASPDIIIEQSVPMQQPRLLNTVLQVLPANSGSVSLLLGGSWTGVNRTVTNQIVEVEIEQVKRV